MIAMLINNKAITRNGITFVACPELEEFKEYTIVAEIMHPNGLDLLFVIEESERWLLQMRFVTMDSPDPVEEGVPHQVDRAREKQLQPATL